MIITFEIIWLINRKLTSIILETKAWKYHLLPLLPPTEVSYLWKFELIAF